MWRLFAAALVPIDNIPKPDVTTATIGSILSTVFVLVGGLSVLFLLIGAVRYVASAGDQSMITQAKNTILYAAVGIVVSLSAFAIVQFVVGTLST
ncbi:MAG TPA: hypothetical protein VM581_00855 [Magnetospirillaceae bacterium]|nr:hypothetical protein [Magnetospirillaceae bacterium]